jgi:hypothetical protein
MCTCPSYNLLPTLIPCRHTRSPPRHDVANLPCPAVGDFPLSIHYHPSSHLENTHQSSITSLDARLPYPASTFYTSMPTSSSWTTMRLGSSTPVNSSIYMPMPSIASLHLSDFYLPLDSCTPPPFILVF